ncbi:GNAT family N-acetyltransferase [uncultured Psychroserpens sp.]|uniref:GNAT family N-acetyltransferase n=1 Tax=uncultured Psychroserpens sp. TaxID=255436 RepID=UPI00262183B0|nr:GNAT family N-acetyltransferase [uncultured Psychroserpens sp.]
MCIVLRAFRKDDFQQVLDIYGDGIRTGIATFETKLPDWSLWNKKYIDHPRIVASIDQDIVGFAVLSKVSQRDVYRGVAEVSVYVAKRIQGKRIGKQLLLQLIKESESRGFWTLQASIFKDNKISIHLHKSCGFRVIGIREKIGKLNNKWFDNVLLERRSHHIGI